MARLDSNHCFITWVDDDGNEMPIGAELVGVDLSQSFDVSKAAKTSVTTQAIKDAQLLTVSMTLTISYTSRTPSDYWLWWNYILHKARWN